jgi:uncharacterized membrane protein SpoIIM required for sporulation
MEYNNIFENKRTNYQGYADYKYQDRSGYAPNMRHSYRHNDTSYKWLYFLEYVKNNRKLKLAIVIAIVLVLAILIAAMVLLLPLISKLIGYINQNGLQGIWELVIDFINKLWKGNSITS